MLAQTGHPSPGDGEAGGSGVQGHPQVHRELKASLGSVSPNLKEEKMEGKGIKEKKKKRKKEIAQVLWLTSHTEIGVHSSPGGHVSIKTNRAHLQGKLIAVPTGTGHSSPLFASKFVVLLLFIIIIIISIILSQGLTQPRLFALPYVVGDEPYSLILLPQFPSTGV